MHKTYLKQCIITSRTYTGKNRRNFWHVLKKMVKIFSKWQFFLPNFWRKCLNFLGFFPSVHVYLKICVAHGIYIWIIILLFNNIASMLVVWYVYHMLICVHSEVIYVPLHVKPVILYVTGMDAILGQQKIW